MNLTRQTDGTIEWCRLRFRKHKTWPYIKLWYGQAEDSRC